MTATILLYLLKANLIVALVWLFCRILLASDTRFRRKRILINCGLGMAFLLPLAGFAFQADEMSDTVIGRIIVSVPAIVYPDHPENDFTEAIPTAVSVDAPAVLLMIYISVSSLLLLRLLAGIISLKSVERRCRKEVIGGFAVYRIIGSATGPFSFFSKIYAGESTTLADYMLSHEAAHIRQHHSIDILFSQLAASIMWLNPAAWMLRNELRDNLEFLADEAAVNNTNRREYQMDMISVALPASINQVCASFTARSVKRRIRMINRISTTSRGRWIYLAALPVMSAAVATGSMRYAQVPPLEDTIAVVETAVDTDLTVADDGGVRPVGYETADAVAVFPGGSFDRFLMKHLEFPESALRDSVCGIVEISFTIDPEGNLTNARVTRSVREDVDNESLEAVRKSPRWIPAPNGRPYECRQIIKFRQMPAT